jgi:NAD(P)-dependent dehydrogenase (short-subunit alcohol dehydrogenase family)
MTTWLITGCSSGLGRSLAKAVLERGQSAVVTARNPASIEDIVAPYPDRGLSIGLDVTDPVQIAHAVQQATGRFSGVDVLVNNAAQGYRAAVEEGDPADVEAVFASNFFGPLALTKAVLPGMRARHQGVIVNVSSIAASFAPAGSGYYAATKLALEGISGSLRREVGPLGIAVIVVEPGSLRTEFTGAKLRRSTTTIEDYGETVRRPRQEHDATHGREPGDPERAAQAIITAVEHPDPPSRLILGNDAVRGNRALLDARRAELDAWEAVSVTTDFPS